MTGRVGRQLNRILLMVPYMARQEGASVNELCRRFKISKGRLMSDLDILFMCGLPDYSPGDLIDYWVEGDRVYVSMADYFSRPLTMTREEALTLVVAGSALIKSGVFKAKSPLGTALEKVESMLSGKEKEQLEGLSGRIDLEVDNYKGQWKNIIEGGLEKRKNLILNYYSFSRDAVTEREVEPLSLLWSRGHWYLHAWCHEAGDTRLFRLDRIESVSRTNHTVTAGDDEEPPVPELVGEYKPGRKTHHVRLRFFGREGRRLIEEWPLARITEEKDGSLKVELRTRNLAWLTNYLLRFGDRMRIEGPRELREMVEDRALGLLKEYS